jgi:hypothetical protein
MAVDAARQHELAGSIDDLARFAEILTKRRDVSDPDADVAREGVGSVRDGPAAN